MVHHSPTESEPNRDRRAIPSVSTIIERWRVGGGRDVAPAIVTQTIQRVLSEIRATIGESDVPSHDAIVARVNERLALLNTPRLTPVINATGVLLHTNLGRAPVSPATAEAMRLTAASPVALEIEPDTGQRGGRMDEISRLMRELTGAESTLVVNNNAAAVLLVLAALAPEREVIVARGQAVEIGGGFRIPDVLQQSGATMVEVGTANRTYASDYKSAVSASTAAILMVHTSNFRIEGFVSEPHLEEIVAVGRAANVPVLEDLGSGSILSPRDFGLGGERTIGESIAAGVAIVTASGDKLLGGPQAGLICGSAAFVSRIERHPLARAVRAGKVTLAGVAETLRHYVRGEATSTVPVWRMIGAPVADLEQRARTLCGRLQIAEGVAVVRPTKSTVGGGSLPGETQESWGIALDIGHPDDVARVLRLGSPAVYARINEHRLVLDLRSVLPEEDDKLCRAITVAIGPQR